MPRVYDFAMRANVPPSDTFMTNVRDMTRNATVVHAQAVWDWYVGQADVQQSDADMLRIIDRCVPPFTATMVEYRDHRDTPVPHTGVMIFRDPTAVGYDVHAMVWVSDLNRLIASFPAIVSVSVDPHGTPDWDTYRVGYAPNTDDERQRHALAGVSEAMAVALLSFRFIHARGVELRDTEPPRHERRRAEKEGDPAPVTFKTLEIGAVTRVLRTEGDIASNGIARALHICRGHFADYTRGAGLFGKHRVEVFVPEHVRGRQERGVIAKDYAIDKARVGVAP